MNKLPLRVATNSDPEWKIQAKTPYMAYHMEKTQVNTFCQLVKMKNKTSEFLT